MRGARQTNKLWTLDAAPTTAHTMNSVVDAPTMAERIAFYHASLFSPTLSTLEEAIRAGFLVTFPTLTTARLRKYPPISKATTMGHMHARRGNKKTRKPQQHPYTANNTSTTPQMPTIIEEDNQSPQPTRDMSPRETTVNIIEPDEDPPSIPAQYPATTPTPLPAPNTAPHANTNTPKAKQRAMPPPRSHPIAIPTPKGTTTINQEPNNKRTHHVFPSVQPITGKIFTDQTGQFPCPSISGNKYLFVLYDYDANYIDAVPMPSRTQHQILIAYKKSTDMLRKRGFTPKLQRLDNECSQTLKDYMDEQEVNYQLTPAGLHRRNNAERAIQTFKNHFIAGLCSTPPNFPLNLWDKLVPQALLTLNILRPSRLNPRLSAYAHVHGAFDYRKTPLAPPGCPCHAHVLPSIRKSWDPHSKDGFYLGPAMEHYQCYNIWTPSTASTRICDTVKWFPHNLKMPNATRDQIIIAAASDLTAALLSTDTDTLLPPIASDTRQHLHDLATTFHKLLPQPSAPTLPLTATQPRVKPTYAAVTQARIVLPAKRSSNIIPNTATTPQASSIPTSTSYPVPLPRVPKAQLPSIPLSGRSPSSDNPPPP